MGQLNSQRPGDDCFQHCSNSDWPFLAVISPVFLRQRSFTAVMGWLALISGIVMICAIFCVKARERVLADFESLAFSMPFLGPIFF